MHERMRNTYKILVKIILKFIWKNRMWRCGLDSTASGLSPVAGSFEQGNES